MVSAILHLSSRASLKKLFRWLGGLALISSLATSWGSPISAHAEEAGSLSLESYLGQVRKSHDGFKGAALNATGYLDQAGEGVSVFLPKLDGGWLYDDDKSPKPSVFAQGDRTRVTQYSLGVSKAWSFGLTSRISYAATFTRISDASVAAVPQPTYWTARPQLELSLPVFGGGFGRSVRAEADLLEASALAQSARSEYQAKQLLAQAESAYWRLALARDVLRLERETLDRAQQIRDWNSRRVKMNLTDASDLFQADALLQLRKIESQSAQDDERAASVAFNLARGSDSETVSERLANSALGMARVAHAPERKGHRWDVESTRQDVRVAQSNAALANEKQKPSVEVYSTLSLNGLQNQLSNAMSDATKSQFSNNVIGVRFSVPLDVLGSTHLSRGYEQQIEAANLIFQRKALEEDSDWSELGKRMQEAVHRLELLQTVEEIQKQKFAHEQQRQKSGKSTNFVVLQFEQDYVSSQINRLRGEGEILSLIAQMKSFDSSASSQ